MYGVLVPTKGGDDIPLKKTELLIGRHNTCDIVLKNGSVSGKHCKLVLMNGYWYVVDLNSSNGTRLNGLRVMDHRIDPGEKVAFATQEYHLRYDPVANGTDGFNPPDYYETDVFSHSLFENAGLNRQTFFGKGGKVTDRNAKKELTQQEIEDGKYKQDYTNLTLDDLTYDR